MLKVNILLEVEQGVVQDPETFMSEEGAGTSYESKVTDKRIGFRKKNDNETWADYALAFKKYEDAAELPGGKLPYDKMDYEIHWYVTDLLP